MGTKIILLSDGTGSSAARIWRTNVWRFFEALDVSRADHKVFYDDGIGSAMFKPFAIIAGMFGFQQRQFFEVGEAADRQPVAVKF